MSELVHIPQHKLPAPGGRAIVREAGLCLALFHVDGKLYAIDVTLPLKNVSLAEWFNSDKENGNDENIKGALHARIQTRGGTPG